MRIGDKVRFLNEVGGGKISAFRPGGIVLVEDEDGFDVPISQSEVVVIEDAPQKVEKKSRPKVEYGTTPIKTKELKSEKQNQESQALNGKEYLKSKTVTPNDANDELDEQFEARIVRLEQALQQQAQTIRRIEEALKQKEEALQKAESRIVRLEAENNLRKNEPLMARQAKLRQKPQPEKSPKSSNLQGLQIL